MTTVLEKERARQASKCWRAAHPEDSYKATRRWIEKNPERRRELQSEHHRKLREAQAAYKLEVGCEKCGYNENSDALQFDHPEPRRGDKRRHPSWIKSWAYFERIKQECDVLCANCHAIKTNAERRAYQA